MAKDLGAAFHEPEGEPPLPEAQGCDRLCRFRNSVAKAGEIRRSGSRLLGRAQMVGYGTPGRLRWGGFWLPRWSPRPDRHFHETVANRRGSGTPPIGSRRER